MNTVEWYARFALFHYEIRAQFIPIEEKNMIKLNEKLECSNYTSFHEVIIKCPKPSISPQLLEPNSFSSEKQLKTGFLGFGDK